MRFVTTSCVIITFFYLKFNAKRIIRILKRPIDKEKQCMDLFQRVYENAYFIIPFKICFIVWTMDLADSATITHTTRNSLLLQMLYFIETDINYFLIKILMVAKNVSNILISM